MSHFGEEQNVLSSTRIDSSKIYSKWIRLPHLKIYSKLSVPEQGNRSVLHQRMEGANEAKVLETLKHRIQGRSMQVVKI